MKKTENKASPNPRKSYEPIRQELNIIWQSISNKHYMKAEVHNHLIWYAIHIILMSCSICGPSANTWTDTNTTWVTCDRTGAFMLFSYGCRICFHVRFKCDVTLLSYTCLWTRGLGECPHTIHYRPEWTWSMQLACRAHSHKLHRPHLEASRWSTHSNKWKEQGMRVDVITVGLCEPASLITQYKM